MNSWYFINSKKAEDFFKIDAKTLHNLLKNNQKGALPNDLKIIFDGTGEQMVISYLKDDEKQEQVVQFKASKVGYGMRYFIVCPTCSKLCNEIYLKECFACRACNGLYYASTLNEYNELERERLAIRKIQKKLKFFSLNLLALPEKKPLQMHWKTFDQLCKQLVNHQVQYAKLKKAENIRLQRRLGL